MTSPAPPPSPRAAHQSQHLPRLLFRDGSEGEGMPVVVWIEHGQKTSSTMTSAPISAALCTMPPTAPVPSGLRWVVQIRQHNQPRVLVELRAQIIGIRLIAILFCRGRRTT